MSVEPTPNYTSEDFDKLGRTGLLELFKEYKISIFYHTEMVGKIPVAWFRPYLLSSFFRIVYHVKTIKPTNTKYFGDMYYYNYEKGTYLPNAEIFFKETIKDWWQDKYLSVKESLVYRDLRASTYMDREEFELDSNYIPVSNGIIKLEKKNSKWSFNFIKNSPEYFVTVRIPTQYVPTAKINNFQRQLDTCLPNKRLEQTWIKQWTGDCLRRKQEFDKAIMAVGDGDNGKTTIFDTIRAMLGLENTVEMSLHHLTENRFASAELANKLALIGDDLSHQDLRDTSTFKKITGGTSQLFAERKGKDPFYFEATLKCEWPANSLPNPRDESDAFMRRWIIMFFDVKFINDPNRKAQIMAGLTTPEELSGILNWALQGLMELLNNDGYTNPPTIETVRSLFRSKSGNAVVRYMYSTFVERKPDGLYLMSKYIVDVNRYALDNNIPTLTQQKIGWTLSQTFPEIMKEKHMYNGKETWFYKGMAETGTTYILDADKERVPFFE